MRDRGSGMAAIGIGLWVMVVLLLNAMGGSRGGRFLKGSDRQVQALRRSYLLHNGLTRTPPMG